MNVFQAKNIEIYAMFMECPFNFSDFSANTKHKFLAANEAGYSNLGIYVSL